MTNNTPGKKSEYIPIPQSYSEDSSLEEELNSIIDNEEFQIIRKNRVYSGNSRNGEPIDNQVKLPEKEQSMDSETFIYRVRGTLTRIKNGKNQAIIHTLSMSRCRIAAFFCSIVLNISIPVAFLLYPCTDIYNCTPPALVQNITSIRKFVAWDTPIYHLDISGPMTILTSPMKDHNDLLFTTVNTPPNVSDISTILQMFDSTGLISGGVIRLNGLDGALMWNRTFTKAPIEMNCTILDVNEDKTDDCLVVGHNYLGMFNASDGRLIWRLLWVEQNNVPNVNHFPIILPDLNQDGVKDLTFVRNPNSIVFISGRKGKPLETINDTECSSITEYGTSHRELGMSYKCIVTNTSSYRIKEISLFKHFNITQHPEKLVHPIPQHQTEPILNFYKIGNFSVTINNDGEIYHDSCLVDVTAKDISEKVVTGLDFSLSFNCFRSWKRYTLEGCVIKPVVFSLKNDVHGFVMKTLKVIDYNYTDLGFPIDNSTVQIKKVEERIKVHILSPHLLTCSLDNFELDPIYIEMLCLNANCRPKIDMQRDSVAVTDLDKDGMLELISYSSTYKQAIDKNGKLYWFLTSKIRVIDIENKINELLSKKKNPEDKTVSSKL